MEKPNNFFMDFYLFQNWMNVVSVNDYLENKPKVDQLESDVLALRASLNPTKLNQTKLCRPTSISQELVH